LSINVAHLQGRLGKDPEPKETEAGTHMCTFSIATDNRWTDKATGEKKVETDWHNIIVWGKLSDVICQYFKRGDEISVIGPYRMKQYEEKETGQKRTYPQVTMNEFSFCGGSRKDEGDPTPTVGTVGEEDNPF